MTRTILGTINLTWILAATASCASDSSSSTGTSKVGQDASALADGAATGGASNAAGGTSSSGGQSAGAGASTTGGASNGGRGSGGVAGAPAGGGQSGGAGGASAGGASAGGASAGGAGAGGAGGAGVGGAGGASAGGAGAGGAGGAGAGGAGGASAGGSSGGSGQSDAGLDASVDASADGSTGADAGTFPVCARGSSAERFASGMVGCSGSVQFSERASLCATGTVCTSTEWVARRAGGVPRANYWTDDELRYTGPQASCWVDPAVGNSCTSAVAAPDAAVDAALPVVTQTPMRVCAPSTNDPLGNVCNWRSCGLDDPGGAPPVNEYFGGCAGNLTAGTLCCPAADAGVSLDGGAVDAGAVDGGFRSRACSDAVAEDVFDGGMAGCAGNVAWADRDTLCGRGFTSCSAAEWVAARAGAAPSHHYWTDDVLRYNGASSACWVSTTVGSSCTTTSGGGGSPTISIPSPMRVCSDTQPDLDGNQCNWTGCGTSSNEAGVASEYFGGCSNNPTAGTLCCL